MPSEMFERGRRDAEADALDENYYHYYYDYKLAYDEVTRNRRRSRRQLLLRRAGSNLLRLLPLLVLLGAGGFTAYRYTRPPAGDSAEVATPTRVRPTLVPPTPRPLETPTLEIALRADSWAVITGTNGARVRVRHAPGTDKNDVIATFVEGQTVHVLEGPQDASGYTWWRVEGDGKSGWAAATFLQPVATPPEAAR
ncbi:MAG TPA: SH3 domain-containing protein [Herpetosiphonaceae bacterium]|nr:SH3 domain-containing protein [Herpetosiphonaceae bacterium]